MHVPLILFLHAATNAAVQVVEHLPKLKHILNEYLLIKGPHVTKVKDIVPTKEVKVHKRVEV